MGILPHIVDRVLNHTDKNSQRAAAAGTYDHSVLDGPKRDALVRWADAVMEVVAPRVADVPAAA